MKFKNLNVNGQKQRSFAALQDILFLDDFHSNIKSLNYRVKDNTDYDNEDFNTNKDDK